MWRDVRDGPTEHAMMLSCGGGVGILKDSEGGRDKVPLPSQDWHPHPHAEQEEDRKKPRNNALGIRINEVQLSSAVEQKERLHTAQGLGKGRSSRSRGGSRGGRASPLSVKESRE
jgi:hypothetical protein